MKLSIHQKLTAEVNELSQNMTGSISEEIARNNSQQLINSHHANNPLVGHDQIGKNHLYDKAYNELYPSLSSQFNKDDAMKIIKMALDKDADNLRNNFPEGFFANKNTLAIKYPDRISEFPLVDLIVEKQKNTSDGLEVCEYKVKKVGEGVYQEIRDGKVSYTDMPSIKPIEKKPKKIKEDNQQPDKKPVIRSELYSSPSRPTMPPSESRALTPNQAVPPEAKNPQKLTNQLSASKAEELEKWLKEPTNWATAAQAFQAGLHAKNVLPAHVQELFPFAGKLGSPVGLSASGTLGSAVVGLLIAVADPGVAEGVLQMKIKNAIDKLEHEGVIHSGEERAKLQHLFSRGKLKELIESLYELESNFYKNNKK